MTPEALTDAYLSIPAGLIHNRPTDAQRSMRRALRVALGEIARDWLLASGLVLDHEVDWVAHTATTDQCLEGAAMRGCQWAARVFPESAEWKREVAPMEAGYTPANLRAIAKQLAGADGKNGRERIAELLGVTVRSVHRWCVDEDRPSHDPMPYPRWVQLREALARQQSHPE